MSLEKKEDVERLEKLEKISEVVDKVQEGLEIVVDTVEEANKYNTTSKADNIQRGVNDARKVLSVFRIFKGLFSIFKRKV
mgnify:CR=1 FL=1